MEDSVGKFLNIFLYAMMGIAAVLGIYYIGIADVTMQTFMLHFYYTYVLFAVAAVVSIVAPIIYIVLNPEKAKSVLIGLAGFLVLAGISFLLASGSTEGAVYENFEVTEAGSRRVGAGLIATYILGIMAVLSIIFSGISKIFK